MLKKNRLTNRWLPMFLVFGLIVCFMTYSHKCQAETPKGYENLLQNCNVMGTIYEASGEVVAYGVDLEQERYGDAYESTFSELIGLELDETIVDPYTVKGRFASVLYGGKQNYMEVINPFQERVGGDIQLTIDGDLQNFAYHLLEAYEESGLLVMNYRTGEVLCAVNDCFKTRRMIGSVMKPIGYACAYDSNPELENYLYNCTCANHIFDNVQINCYGGKYHGVMQNMETALTVSCNGYAVSLAKKVEEDVLLENLGKFGFDKVLSYPNNYLAFADNSYYGAEGKDIDNHLKLMAAIGGGNCMSSPASLAISYSALFNQGVAVAPYIVSAQSVFHGGELVETEKNPEVRMCSAQAATQMVEMMVNVTENGTGKSVKTEGVRVACKTGTAMKNDSENILWMVTGILDEENPYLLVSFVDHAPSNWSCGNTVGTVSKAIIDYLLSQEAE